MVITEKKITDFCELFYAAHYLPISCFATNNISICSFSPFESPISLYRSVLPALLNSEINPAVFFSADFGSYGIIRTSNYYIIIGPAFSDEITDEILHNFMHENAIERDQAESLKQALSGIPRYSYNHFLNLLSFLNFELNKKKISVAEHFNIIDSIYGEKIANIETEQSYIARDERRIHGTYDFERQMIDYVKRGETKKLKVFLLDALNTEKFQEGKLADTPLRQAKNLFIGVVTTVGKYGAIRGGLDVEQTYHLIDAYIQECEKLQSLETIKTLQYNMIIDFTSRVEQSKIPDGTSEEVFSCIQFISTNTNESIGVPDVAEHIGKSRAYIAAKFKKELGINIGEYITNYKLTEAKSLLKHTNKSLLDISNYLCFSSQSYFQNLFKRNYGITPAKYRKQNQQ